MVVDEVAHVGCTPPRVATRPGSASERAPEARLAIHDEETP
jgi:hypothetical protein